MKIKWISLTVFIVIINGLWFWSACTPTQNPDQKKAGSGQTKTSIKEAEGGNYDASAHLPVVSEVTLRVKSDLLDSIPSIILEKGLAKQLKGTPYHLRLTDFFTHWNWDKVPVNVSNELRNPAAKIEVWKDDTLYYSQWAFKTHEFFSMDGTMSHAGGGQKKDLAFTLDGFKGLELHDPSSHAKGTE